MHALELASMPLEWVLGRGDESFIVLSSRIRLARNLARYPFPWRCERDSLCEIEGLIVEAASKSLVLRNSFTLKLSQMDKIARMVLVENHLVSPNFVQGDDTGRAVIFDDRGIVSLMLNEEDHLRIQVFLGGLQLHDAWHVAKKVDEELECLNYAFNCERGYLSSCPTNAGTGLRASVMLHIPGIVALGHVGHVARECSRVGLTVRGMYGEGTPAGGCLFQVSNQITLGLSEEELVEKVNSVALGIVEREHFAREKLIKQRGIDFVDRIWRSLGIVSCARKLSVKEALELLSKVRMGSEMGILPAISQSELNRMILNSQPGHVIALSKSCKEDEIKDIRYIETKRAEILRDKLSRFLNYKEN